MFPTNSLATIFPDSGLSESSRNSISSNRSSSLASGSKPESFEASRWALKPIDENDNNTLQKIEDLQRMDVTRLTDCLAKQVFEDFRSLISKNSPLPAEKKICGRVYFIHRYESGKIHDDLFGKAMEETRFSLLRFNDELRSSRGDVEEKIYVKIQRKFLFKIERLIDNWLEKESLTDKISPTIIFENYSRILSEGKTMLHVEAYVCEEEPQKKTQKEAETDPQKDDVSCFSCLSSAIKRPPF